MFEYTFGDYSRNTQTLVCVFPQLQPNVELFQSNHTFIGCCIDETLRNETTLNINAQLNDILNLKFNEINPNFDQNLNESKLIYISLGTIFNTDIKVFQKIIKSLEMFSNSNFKIHAVISVGSKSFQKLNKTKYDNNIIIVPFAPQIALLKRAHLFITHSGMNSISETIEYGVPCICLPQGEATDQPFVARRVTNDLKIGLQLQSDRFTVNQMYNAINEVLSNNNYLERILHLTKLSKRYNGVVNGANEIIQSIESKSSSFST
jgi:MGT family glycosyltransferase